MFQRLIVQRGFDGRDLARVSMSFGTNGFEISPCRAYEEWSSARENRVGKQQRGTELDSAQRHRVQRKLLRIVHLNRDGGVEVCLVCRWKRLIE